MTTLTRPVTRRTRGAYSVLYPRPRQIIVTLANGDLLEFREAGRRAKWMLPIEAAFRQAVRAKAASDLAARGTRKQRA